VFQTLLAKHLLYGAVAACVLLPLLALAVSWVADCLLCYGDHWREQEAHYRLSAEYRQRWLKSATGSNSCRRPTSTWPS
jgi:hypothetical protein